MSTNQTTNNHNTTKPNLIKFKKGVWIFTKIIIYFHILLLLVVGILSFYYINHYPKYTSLMLYRVDYQAQAVDDNSTIKLRHVPESFKKSLVHLEDPKFWKHWGVDLGAIKRAFKLNKKMGYKAYGGSTISQQLARTLFLTPHKNYVRKYLEVWIALELELILGKERILELYLNYAEWGDKTYGVADAAQTYYNRPLASLTKDEQICLITILASPIKYDPTTFARNRMLRVRYKFLNTHWH